MPITSKLSLDGDLLVVFDNNKVLSRAWHVKVEGKFTSNVITMVLYFQIDGLDSLQWQSELKPGQWLFNDDEQTRKRVGYIKHFDQIADVTDVHNKEFLTSFLNDILNEVAAEQSVSVDKICSDHVDDLVTEALQGTSYKECFNDKCTATPEQNRSVPKNKINCPYCRKNLRLSHQEIVWFDSGSTYVLPKPRQQGTTSATKKSFRVWYDPDRETSLMEEVFSENQDHEPPSKSYLSEPVFGNPCSYNSVITILRNIGKKLAFKSMELVLASGLQFIVMGLHSTCVSEW